MSRILGCVLVLLSCGLFSIKLHFQLLEGFQEWCLFQSVLLEIRRNNKLACVVMADLLKETVNSMPPDSIVAEATRTCITSLKEQKMSMEWIWEQYMDRIQMRLHLPAALLIQVKRLGRVISHKDSETIDRYLEGICNLLTEEIEARSKSLRTKDMVRSSLCAMTGIMTILLLI